MIRTNLLRSTAAKARLRQLLRAAMNYRMLRRLRSQFSRARKVPQDSRRILLGALGGSGRKGSHSERRAGFAHCRSCDRAREATPETIPSHQGRSGGRSLRCRRVCICLVEGQSIQATRSSLNRFAQTDESQSSRTTHYLFRNRRSRKEHADRGSQRCPCALAG